MGFIMNARMSSFSPFSPIGIFDSGVGGLSVLRQLRRQLPYEPLIFLADQAHVPYGPRSIDEVRGFAEAISRYLRMQGAKLVVVACNAASAAALLLSAPDLPGLAVRRNGAGG